MSDISEIKSLIEQQGDAFAAFKQRLDDLELKQARGPLAGAQGGDKPTPKSAGTWIDTKTKSRIPVLAAGDSLAALEAKSADDGTPTLGRVLRGLVMGGQADDARELADERKALSIGSDPAGGYTVGGALSSRWIDLLRAQMVLNRAGVLTVPMDTGSLSLARLTGDPAVSWHAENAALTGADATFGSMTLQARTVVCLVKMSLELSQDSANIEQILQSSITNAMAGAIDAAGLVGVGAHPGIFDLPGRNTVTAIGEPDNWDFVVDGMYELMADNVDMADVGAMIAHPALWRKMSKLKSGISGDNTTLAVAPEVARLPRLWTTAAPLAGGTTAKAVLGNWSDYLFGVRKNITVKVLQESFMGSNLQLAVLAYARVDFGATRAASFCTMEGITVA